MVTLDFPSTSKFGHCFRPKSVGVVLKVMVLPWEVKFGHGSPRGSSILSLVLPSTSRFGHRFCPEYVGEVLGAMILPWEEKFGHD